MGHGEALFKCRLLLIENTTLCTLSRGRSFSIVESDGIIRSIPPPPPPRTPNPAHSVDFVQASTPNGHGMLVSPCCKFHCFCSLRGSFLPCGAPASAGVAFKVSAQAPHCQIPP